MFPKIKKFKVVSSQHISLKSVVSGTFFNATINKSVKTQQLLSLSQGNEQDLTKYPNNFLTCAILLNFKNFLNRMFSEKTICMWPTSRQLIALSQKNKIVYYAPSYQFKTSGISNFWQVSLLDLCKWTQIKSSIVPWLN